MPLTSSTSLGKVSVLRTNVIRSAQLDNQHRLIKINCALMPVVIGVILPVVICLLSMLIVIAMIFHHIHVF